MTKEQFKQLTVKTTNLKKTKLINYIKGNN